MTTVVLLCPGLMAAFRRRSRCPRSRRSPSRKVAILGSSPGSVGENEDPVKFGFLNGQSGDYGLWGGWALAAAEVAVEELNAAGGVLGREVELVVEDDGVHAGGCSVRVSGVDGGRRDPCSGRDRVRRHAGHLQHRARVADPDNLQHLRHPGARCHRRRLRVPDHPLRHRQRHRRSPDGPRRGLSQRGHAGGAERGHHQSRGRVQERLHRADGRHYHRGRPLQRGRGHLRGPGREGLRVEPRRCLYRSRFRDRRAGPQRVAAPGLHRRADDLHD